MMEEGILFFIYRYRATIPSFDIRNWKRDILRFVFILAFRHGQFQPQGQFVQLGPGRFRRGVGQQAGRTLGLGESDDVANGGLAAEQHHQAVEAEGNAPVGRSTGFQGVQQETELLPIDGRFHPQRREDALL
jgi:hypothetical protein